jgi:hypothetical protein
VACKPDVLGGLANVLSYFSANEIEDALPTTKKGGSEHHETRNVASPRYISEAIAGILRATQPTDGPSFQTPFIIKRLDDHVLWKSALKPWRRSPIWLLIRVSLQTTLSEWGVADGFGYKAFQAFFMAKILKKAIDADPNSLTIDLLYFMNAKLARRLAKMGNHFQDEAIEPLRRSGKIVEDTSVILKQRWGQITTQWEEREQWTPPDPSAFKGCLNITFANSQKYLRKVINRRQELDRTVKTFNKAVTEKKLRSACAPRAGYTPQNLPISIPRDEPDFSLFDLESWVKNHLPEWTKSPSRSENDCLPLTNLINKYREVASAHYKGSPEKLSLMHLCILELWVALDSVVAKWCPLLLDYSPEIPVNYLDPLLLPYFEQLQRLNQVQTYLQQRHQRASLRSGYSLLKNLNGPHSFANRFFGLPIATPLVCLQREIQSWANKRRSEKIAELNKLNAEHQSLLRQAESLVCLSSKSKKKKHKKKCEKCKLKSTASDLRIIPIEEPLPESPEKARTIIFELQCPLPIAVWRDTVKTILRTDAPHDESKPEHYLLSKYDPLDQFFRAAYSGHWITIASSSKSISQSHYGNKRPVPATVGQVIHKSAGNFSMFDSIRRRWLKVGHFPDLRPQCTLLLEGPYKSLQGYMDSVTHTSNEVIASQHQCPTGMSIDEYIVFGQLRSGNRLQWRNIVRVLRTQTLTFSECSVYFLILQAIWQAGPIGVEGLYREAHSDLKDTQFCQEVLTELRTLLGIVKDNWTQTLFLACIVALAVRIHNFSPMSEAVQSQASSILMEARNVAFQWMSTLRKSPSEHCNANNQSKQALVGASLVLRTTFDVENRKNNRLFDTVQDIVWYLYAGTITSGHILESLSSGIRLLAHRDRWISRRLHPYIHSFCTINADLLHSVISLKWDSSVSGSHWMPLGGTANRWWCSIINQGIEEERQTVHLNIIDGDILIEGKSFDRLPTDYTSHPTYKSLFNIEVIWFRSVLLLPTKSIIV